MKRITETIAALFVAAVALLSCNAFAQPEAIELSSRGPQVGDSLPEFSLPDQNGDLWTQDSIIGDNGTMLVFLRSADW